MSKYYKAEDVINAIEDKIAEYIPTLYGRYAEIPLELRMAIEHLPTIDIVTCKDCKRCEKELVIERRADGKETIVNLCNKTSPPTIVPLDFYCKDGERKE